MMGSHPNKEELIGIQMRRFVHDEGHRGRLPPDMKKQDDVRQRAKVLLAWIAANPGVTRAQMMIGLGITRAQLGDMLGSLTNKLHRNIEAGHTRYRVKS